MYILMLLVLSANLLNS